MSPAARSRCATGPRVLGNRIPQRELCSDSGGRRCRWLTPLIFGLMRGLRPRGGVLRGDTHCQVATNPWIGQLAWPRSASTRHVASTRCVRPSGRRRLMSMDPVTVGIDATWKPPPLVAYGISGLPVVDHRRAPRRGPEPIGPVAPGGPVLSQLLRGRAPDCGSRDLMSSPPRLYRSRRLSPRPPDHARRTGHRLRRQRPRQPIGS